MLSMIKKFFGIFPKIGNILKTTGIATLAIVIILIILIWTVGPLVSVAGKEVFDTPSARLAATFSLIFAWIIFMAIFLSSSKKQQEKNPDLELIKQEKKKAELAISKEKAKIRKTIADAVKITESSNFYGSTSRSRYALPWYLVLGAENSGKTSVLLNSGLKFPINEQSDRSLYNLKSTSDCEFLYSNNAIFIDTPGHYMDSQKASPKSKTWFTFLHELFKARSARPLNGIILCLSMRDLINADQNAISHISYQVREKLANITQKLHSQIPVYLILTKCDAVPGFSQFFAQMSRSEREQVFGALSYEDFMNSDEIHLDLESLLTTINRQVIGKVHNERDLNSRSAIFMFPQEMAKVIPKLEDFIFETFGPSRYQKPVMFRGFFFSSSLSSHDIINNAAMQGEWSFQTGFQPSLGDYAKGFFLSSFFSQLVIPEAGLAETDKSRWFTSRFSQYASKIAVFVLLICSVALLGFNFTNNSEKLDNLEQIQADFKQVNQQSPSYLANDLQALLPQLQLLESSTKVFNPKTDKALSYKVGLYQGDKANDVTKLAYKTELNGSFLRIIRSQAAQQVENSFDDLAELKKALRVYLMLYNPKYLDKNFLNAWQSKYWSTAYSGKAQVQAELLHQLDSLVNYGIIEAEPNYDLLTRARQVLMKVPHSELAYQQLKEEAQAAAKPAFSFRLAIGEQLSPFSGDTYAIPYLYTKEGFEEYLLRRCPSLIRELTSDKWMDEVHQAGVLNFDLSESDVQRVHKEVALLYYQDYVKHWNAAVTALVVPPPNSLTAVSQVAYKLSSGATPAVLVLRKLRYHTDLITDPNAAKKAAKEAEKNKQNGEQTLAENVAPTETANSNEEDNFEYLLPQTDALAVKQYFATLDSLLLEDGSPTAALNGTNENMAAVSNYFSKLSATDQMKEQIFMAFLNIMTNKDEMLRNLDISASKLPPEVSRWYKIPLDAGLSKMSVVAAEYLDYLYQDEVLSVYNSSLRDYFPFNPNSPRDVNLDDFVSFFAPGGLADNFKSKHLAPFIGENGTLKTVLGHRIAISPKAVTQFNRASLVRDAFFAGGVLSVNFQLEPYTMDTTLKMVTLTNDDKTISYWHGPIIGAQFNWPGGRNSSILYESLNGLTQEKSTQGEWSLFRLFRHGDLKRRVASTGNGALVELKSKDAWVRFNILYRNRANAFDPAIYVYTPPQSLL